MGIDKIGPINNYNSYNKINKKNSLEKTNNSDSVNISKEALNKAEQNKIFEIVNNAPDIREDKVRILKEKINNPDYLDNVINNSLVDKMMDILD